MLANSRKRWQITGANDSVKFGVTALTIDRICGPAARDAVADTLVGCSDVVKALC
jgi:hypothetical protein